MVFGGLHADVENLRDLLGGLALDHQMKSLALACGQAFVRVVAVMARAMLAFGQRLGRTRTEIGLAGVDRSEEHTYELQSLMRISYAVCCLKQKQQYHQSTIHPHNLTQH